MTQAGLAGVSRRKFVVTTVKDGGRQAPDLVERNFTAEAPDRLWVADITYIPTWSELSLSRGRARCLQPSHCRLVDGHVTRQTTGHRCTEHGAGDEAAPRRDPSLPTRVRRYTSDRGSVAAVVMQACAHRWARSATRGRQPAMCRISSRPSSMSCSIGVGSRAQTEARRTVFEFIEGFYNPRRRHSSIGYLPTRSTTSQRHLVQQQ